MKLQVYDLTPWDQVVYLDADTVVHQPLDAGFEMLDDGWDIALAPSVNQGDEVLWHVDEEEREYTFERIGYPLPLQYQCGVMFFAKRPQVKRLFDRWRDEWLIYKGQDQGAFLRALHACPDVRAHLLGRPYNGGAVVSHHFGTARA